MFKQDFIFPCANTHIINQELEDTINKFGSFITLISNKPISCVSLFILINKSPELKILLLKLTDTSWYSVVEYMAHRYPVLNKSKKIKK
jgi:hypothetical protein